MKTSKNASKSYINGYTILLVLLCAVSAILFSYQFNNSKAESQRRYQSYKESTEKIAADNLIALRLVNKSWYVVNDTTVSSEKNGKGEVVVLPKKLQAKGSRLGIIHVVSNLQVTFNISELKSYLGANMVADNLSYSYENEKEILAGNLPSIR